MLVIKKRMIPAVDCPTTRKYRAWPETSITRRALVISLLPIGPRDRTGRHCRVIVASNDVYCEHGTPICSAPSVDFPLRYLLVALMASCNVYAVGHWKGWERGGEEREGTERRGGTGGAYLWKYENLPKCFFRKTLKILANTGLFNIT